MDDHSTTSNSHVRGAYHCKLPQTPHMQEQQGERVLGLGGACTRYGFCSFCGTKYLHEYFAAAAEQQQQPILALTVFNFYLLYFSVCFFRKLFRA